MNGVNNRLSAKFKKGMYKFSCQNLASKTVFENLSNNYNDLRFSFNVISFPYTSLNLSFAFSFCLPCSW